MPQTGVAVQRVCGNAMALQQCAVEELCGPCVVVVLLVDLRCSSSQPRLLGPGMYCYTHMRADVASHGRVPVLLPAATVVGSHRRTARTRARSVIDAQHVPFLL